MKHLPSPAARRTLAVLAAGTVAALALAGCSTGDTGSGGSAAGDGSFDSVEAALEKGGEITYWSWTPSAEAQVEAFEKEYPNVKVNVVNAGTNNEEYTKLQNAIKAGSGAPDVVQVEYYAFPQFALTDAFVDLSQYGFADFEDDYTASTWNSVTDGDAIYGLPQDSGPMALFYNKAVFDAAGVAVPTTWDEYYEAAKAIHAANPDAYITNDTGDAGFATSMIWQAGGKPFATSGTDVTIDLQDDGSPASAENGGGGQAVTTQSKNPELAAGFLWWLNNSEESISTFLESGGFPSTTAELSSDEFLADAPEYFGGQKINEVLAAAADDVVEGWSYLPYQVYGNSIFGDTVGQSYQNGTDLNEGLVTWQDALVEYGNSQGFAVNK